MKIELNKVYFFQDKWHCSFIKTIRYDGSRMVTIHCFNLFDAINLPIYQNNDLYESYRETGEVTSISSMEVEYLTNQIIIPIEDVISDRLRKITKSGRTSHPMTIAVHMNKSEIESFKRNRKIEKILDGEEK